jgi:hypothetical protein
MSCRGPDRTITKLLEQSLERLHTISKECMKTGQVCCMLNDSSCLHGAEECAIWYSEKRGVPR